MDFIAFRPNFLYIVEVKNGLLSPSAQALTDSEIKARAYWGPYYYIINSVDVAIKVLQRNPQF